VIARGDGLGLTSILHPTGNSNVRMAARALFDVGNLDQLVTSIGRPKSRPFPPGLPEALKRELRKRSYELPSDNIRQRRREEIFRNVLLHSPSRQARRLAEPWSPFGVNWVARKIDQSFAHSMPGRAGLQAVMGYQGTSVASFRQAKALGLARVLEITHAHWRTTELIYDRSAERDPEWNSTIARPNSAGREEADEQISLATIVLSPSRQVTDSLRAVNPQLPIIFNPYGCPPVQSDVRVRSWDGSAPLRALFVGRLTAGKGIAALAAAVEMVGNAMELTIVGARPNAESPALDRLIQQSRYLGTLPHGEVLAEMRKAHVFVLPSLVEGRSLAALEAMSSGLPMIVSPGSGVDDLVEEGAGQVVPNGDAMALVHAIQEILTDRALVQGYSERAIAIAAANGWDGYRRVIQQLSLP